MPHCTGNDAGNHATQLNHEILENRSKGLGTVPHQHHPFHFLPANNLAENSTAESKPKEMGRVGHVASGVHHILLRYIATMIRARAEFRTLLPQWRPRSLRTGGDGT